MKRKIPLATGEIYHIFSRSIAEYNIFNSSEEYLAFEQRLQYYQFKTDAKFSDFIALKMTQNLGFENLFKTYSGNCEKLIQIIAYCIMPTHIHLVLKQLKDEGISNAVGNLFNSYTKVFNTKHKRKGPLWEAKFNNVLVESDEQLLHLTRYIHLNPVTAYLVKKPEEWKYSSYNEYVTGNLKLTDFENILDIIPRQYRNFVNDRISYQRELAKIKSILLD